MKLFMLLLILAGVLLAEPVLTADMAEIEVIRAEVGPNALIVPVPDYNCTHIYIIRKEDESIWVYSARSTVRGRRIVRKALIFRGDRNEQTRN